MCKWIYTNKHNSNQTVFLLKQDQGSADMNNNAENSWWWRIVAYLSSYPFAGVVFFPWRLWWALSVVIWLAPPHVFTYKGQQYLKCDWFWASYPPDAHYYINWWACPWLVVCMSIALFCLTGVFSAKKLRQARQELSAKQ